MRQVKIRPKSYLDIRSQVAVESYSQIGFRFGSSFGSLVEVGISYSNMNFSNRRGQIDPFY